MTLGNHRENNFDFLRLLAAFMVIFGHGHALLGQPYQFFWGMSIQAIGVGIFFSISGYLIVESWQRDPNIFRFLWKRSLRIFPALILCVTLTAFLLGPLVTQLSFNEYFRNESFRNYFYNIALNIQYFLPGVFSDNIYKSAVNGSLWSLPVEYFCYFLVAIFLFFQGSGSKVGFISLAVVIIPCAYYLGIIYAGPQIVIWGTDVAQATFIIPFFLVGGSLALVKNQLPLRLDLAFIMTFTLLAVQEWKFEAVLVFLNWLFLPYIIVSFAVNKTLFLAKSGYYGDISYGMYLYSFPIQQYLIYASSNTINFNQLFMYSSALSCLSGWLSWHLIEHRALRFKSVSTTAHARTAQLG